MGQQKGLGQVRNLLENFWPTAENITLNHTSK
jgi:hypothetical protein